MADPRDILVTGASGFIARHVVLRLLNAGHRVTGSVRAAARRDEIRAAVAPLLADPTALDRLDFVTLDLTADAGWDNALAGRDVLVHTASPFPISQPKDPGALIGPAVEGTRRALCAAHAAGVGRVVLTSSSAAVVGGPARARPFTEDDWSDIDDPTMMAYSRSKTLAERAAWGFVQEKSGGIALTTINPVFVIGPPLDGRFGSSVGVIRRVLSGKDPMIPRIGFALVDVRDVAEMHLRAVERPETAGQRFIAADRSMWFAEIAEVLRAACPDRRIARRVAPDLLMRALALFDPQIRTILPSLGRLDKVSSARARQVMGIRFIDASQSLRDTARFLINSGAV